MNDRLCTLGLPEIIATIAYESINNLVVAKKLEENVKNKGKGGYPGITNMLEYHVNRNVASFIETNILHNKYNDNILLFQEQIFVRKKEENAMGSESGFEKSDKSQMNYIEKNRIAIFQTAISNFFLKYAEPKNMKLNILPVLVYLGEEDEQFNSEYMLSMISTTYLSDAYTKFCIVPNKDFLFLDVRSIDWDKMLDLEFNDDNTGENEYRAKKLIIAGYYKMMLLMYDDNQLDEIVQILQKMHIAMKYLLDDCKEIYSYLMGIRANLTDKMNFFKVENRVELEQYFEQFLNIKLV